jgi:hypothetical protein
MKITNIRHQTNLPSSRLFPSTYTLMRSGPKVGRNDKCPCGSGKKYKKCCWRKDQTVRTATTDDFIQDFLAKEEKKGAVK